MNMKITLIILLFTIITQTVNAQSFNTPNRETGIAMGLSGGYSSKQCVIGTLSIGAMLSSQNLVSMNMVVLSEIKNPNIPTIFEGRVAHFFNTIELYGGAGYHIAGSDNKIATNPNTGIKPALGVVKHFQSSPWTVGAGLSGTIFSIQVGLFGIR